MNKIIDVDDNSFHVNNISFINKVVQNGSRWFFTIGLRDGRDLIFGGYQTFEVARDYQSEARIKWKQSEGYRFQPIKTEIVKKQTPKNSYKKNPIEELGLPEKLNSILISNEIFTIEDLTKLTEIDILNIRNIGEIQLSHIKKAIEKQIKK